MYSIQNDSEGKVCVCVGGGGGGGGDRAQELCEIRGGRPGLPVPNSPYGLCGRKATVNSRPRAV